MVNSIYLVNFIAITSFVSFVSLCSILLYDVEMWNNCCLLYFQISGLFLLTMSSLLIHDWQKTETGWSILERFGAGGIIGVTLSSIQLLTTVLALIREWRAWMLIHLVIFLSTIGAATIAFVYEAHEKRSYNQRCADQPIDCDSPPCRYCHMSHQIGFPFLAAYGVEVVFIPVALPLMYIYTRSMR